MARLGGKSQSYIQETSVTDKVAVQLRNDNDSSLLLGQLNCVPIASCSTAAATAAKVATINTKSIFKNLFSIDHSFQRNGSTVTEKLIGMCVIVQFSYANTNSSPTLNIGGTGEYPITVNGQRMGAGALGAGNYRFRLVPYSSSYAWECEDNGGIVSTDSTKTNNSAAGAIPLNSALTDLNVKSITPTVEVNIDGGWGTYTLNYCKMQRVGDFYFCYGSIKVGSDALKKYLYIAITGDGVNFSRDNGYRLDSRVVIINSNDGTSEGGILHSTGTRALWLRKGYSTSVNTEASTFSGLELAGKTVTFSFMASKIS